MSEPLLPYEQWMSIIDYEGMYEVSNLGRVRSLSRYIKNKNRSVFVKERILRSGIGSAGYSNVLLCMNGRCITYKVHRLVAIAFLPNPDNLPQVNHIDGNKTNNYVSNLEWCTTSENMQHAIHVLGRKIGTNINVWKTFANKLIAKIQNENLSVNQIVDLLKKL